MLDKYKAAATAVANALQALIPLCVEDADVIELCNKGDKLVEEATAALYNKVKGTPKGKLFPFPCAEWDNALICPPLPLPAGIAFPTSLAVNNIILNYSPVPPKGDVAATVLAKDDVVKITLGAHIDGYAVVSAETSVQPRIPSATAFMRPLTDMLVRPQDCCRRL